MTRIIVTGINGRMGKAIEDRCNSSDSFLICAGVDIDCGVPHRFPTVDNISKIDEEADAIIDFSHHTAVNTILPYAAQKNIPVVLCTTGHTDDEKRLIKEYTEKVAVFKSANMSLGVNLLIELAKKAAATLVDYDIEIIEKHHNKKLDAPSGTALMVADSINSVLSENKQYVYDRTCVRQKREKSEIGITSVRGGNIVGEHDVMFIGSNEILTVSHSAQSREVFADGALRAAEFIAGKKNGLYSMEDLLAEII